MLNINTSFNQNISFELNNKKKNNTINQPHSITFNSTGKTTVNKDIFEVNRVSFLGDKDDKIVYPIFDYDSKDCVPKLKVIEKNLDPTAKEIWKILWKNTKEYYLDRANVPSLLVFILGEAIEDLNNNKYSGEVIKEVLKMFEVEGKDADSYLSSATDHKKKKLSKILNSQRRFLANIIFNMRNDADIIATLDNPIKIFISNLFKNTETNETITLNKLLTELVNTDLENEENSFFSHKNIPINTFKQLLRQNMGLSLIPDLEVHNDEKAKEERKEMDKDLDRLKFDKKSFNKMVEERRNHDEERLIKILDKLDLSDRKRLAFWRVEASRADRTNYKWPSTSENNPIPSEVLQQYEKIYVKFLEEYIHDLFKKVPTNTSPQQHDTGQTINDKPEALIKTPNKYTDLNNDEIKTLLNNLINSSNETEALQTIKELGESGNKAIIIEILQVLKNVQNEKLNRALKDAVLNIDPNNLKLKLLLLEHLLDKRVIGQNEAKLAVANSLRASALDLGSENSRKKPIGTFMFLGPTGVGKTELAKALAEILYGDESKLLRFNMSEYTEARSDKNKLLGAPPGYIGYDEGGNLTERVRKNPKSVILLDEIEKADRNIYDLFLQIADDGIITDAQGNDVSFKDTVIIMTSNLGSKSILKSINEASIVDRAKDIVTAIINRKSSDNNNISKIVNNALKGYFKPEFLNRIDRKVIFKPLTTSELNQILSLKLKPIENNLRKKFNMNFEISDSARNYIINTTKEKEFGFSGRELKRVLEQEIDQVISEKLLKLELFEDLGCKNIIPRGGKVVVDLKNSKLSIDITK